MLHGNSAYKTLGFGGESKPLALWKPLKIRDFLDVRSGEYIRLPLFRKRFVDKY